jgi:hypothetical protein
MAPTFTKSTKRGGRNGRVTFKFNSRGLGKNIDLNQTVDSPIGLFRKSGSSLLVSENGNMYSPIDGEAFLDINSNKASVKPLVLTFEVPIISADPTTGQPVQTGTESVTRTFDNIPKMAIMDDEFNVYFVEKDGIEFNSNGFVDKITARIINQNSAPKQKFSKEEDFAVDSDGDGETDGYVDLFDFPQLYFFDMRQAGEQLQEYCVTASINNFPLENNADDILNIVGTAQTCLQDWRDSLVNSIQAIRANRDTGTLTTNGFDVSVYEDSNTKVTECFQKAADDICKYALNSLNTSFKAIDDKDFTSKPEYVDGLLQAEILGEFDQIGPSFTGASEYAAGIGDNAVVETNSAATIEIIPRDPYDNEVAGDFADRIVLEIISDETNSASFILNNGLFVTKNGNKYTGKLTATNPGEVRIRAKICDRTIQSLTYQGVESTINPNDKSTDCIPDSDEAAITAPPLGAVVKVDRILSIYFIKQSSSFVSSLAGAEQGLAITEPQEFGTSLEN